jgi:hypothetical protein
MDLLRYNKTAVEDTKHPKMLSRAARMPCTSTCDEEAFKEVELGTLNLKAERSNSTFSSSSSAEAYRSLCLWLVFLLSAFNIFLIYLLAFPFPWDADFSKAQPCDPGNFTLPCILLA